MLTEHDFLSGDVHQVCQSEHIGIDYGRTASFKFTIGRNGDTEHVGHILLCVSAFFSEVVDVLLY